MKTKQALMILALGIVALLGAMAAFNYFTDPQCYYRCAEVTADQRTLNVYYQVAQRILAFPKAELVILGSSRGETTPPLWIEKSTGMTTLNLSASGAELGTKLAFLKISEEKLPLKKVIWLADYFELISENADAKIKNTPALRKYLKGVLPHQGWSQTLHDVQGLIDHNTLEASLYFVNNKAATQITQGSGSDIDFNECQSPSFKGKETPESLKKEVDLLYQSYAHGVIKPAQNPKAWDEFSQEMIRLAGLGIEVVVVVIPYHADFLSRLKSEFPEIVQRHQEWIQKVHSLKDRNVKVLDYFEGLPGDDKSPALWNDGVHFTCKGSMLMLNDTVQSWKKAL